MPVRSEGMSWNGKWSATRWSRQDRARVVQGLVFGVLGIAGAYVASRLSATVAPAALLAAFSVLMLVVAAMMVACRRAQLRAAAAGEVETGSPVGSGLAAAADARVRLPAGPESGRGGLGCRAAGWVLRCGRRLVVVPALVLALGFTMPVVVGTSLLVIAIKSTSALLSRMGHGVHLDWPLIGGFTLAATVGSLLGGRLATRVRPQRLTAAFTMLLVAVAQYTAARSFPQLL